MTTTTELLNKIENLIAAMSDELAAKPATSKEPWMMDSTTEDDAASASNRVAPHAARILEINRAIIALSEGKTVTETALGHFVISQ